MGWASGAFGLFGLKKENANIIWMNYLGAALAVASVVLYVGVEPNDSKVRGKS